MFEMAAQSGVRPGECTTSRNADRGLSKIPKAPEVWWINGRHATGPPRAKLLDMAEADGPCLSPATSECGRWGTKHGGKVMHFPVRSAHAWNGCRAHRECMLHHPVAARDQANTPVFLAVDATATQASLVRTVLHHMLKHDHMLPVLPKDRTNKYSFHSFRKFYTTGLKQAGVSNEIIQSLLRWSAVEVIADATTCFEPHPVLGGR